MNINDITTKNVQVYIDTAFDSLTQEKKLKHTEDGKLISIAQNEFNDISLAEQAKVLKDIEAILITACQANLVDKNKAKITKIENFRNQILDNFKKEGADISDVPKNVLIHHIIDSCSLEDLANLAQVSRKFSESVVLYINIKKTKIKDIFPETTAKEALEWLTKNPHAYLLKYANFSDFQNFDDECLNQLLKSCKNLKSLLLNKCDITKSEAEVIAKSEALGSLKELELFGNNIGNEGVKVIANSQALPSLNQLNLGANKIGKEGVEAIANSKTLPSLNELILSLNKIGNEGAEAIANSEALGSLKKLLLLRCDIGDKGAKAIANSKKLRSLNELQFLKYNKISKKVIEEIANSETLRSVKTLL